MCIGVNEINWFSSQLVFLVYTFGELVSRVLNIMFSNCFNHLSDEGCTLLGNIYLLSFFGLLLYLYKVLDLSPAW